VCFHDVHNVQKIKHICTTFVVGYCRDGSCISFCVVSIWYRKRSELWRGGVKVVKAKISKRSVDGAATPSEGEARLWDTDLKGFLLRIYPSGRKVYAVKCRVGRVQRIYTIGEHGSPWSPDEARRAALEALQKARHGEDPSADKKAAKAALSVGQLIDRYLADGPATKPAKRASTWVIDASNLNRHLRPLLGTKIAAAISRAEAARAIRDITDGKTEADIRTRPRGRARVTGGQGASRRTRNVAAAMFSWGMEHDLCASNPFLGIALASAPVRERFLTKEEAGGLLDTIAKLESAGVASNTFADALRVLLLTGARKTEILGLKWSEVDAVRGILNLPPDRTKAGGKTGVRRIQLSPPALEILRVRREQLGSPAVQFQAGSNPLAQSEFVFPAARGEGHAVGLSRIFQKVCVEAHLPGLRIHDLRHSFASFAVANGASLFLVGKLLGHASARTTERYAHLSGDPLQDAVNSIGRDITGTDR
jgi:integrase